MMSDPAYPAQPAGRSEASSRSRALAVRLFLAMLSTQELLTIYIGVRLGLYDALADGSPASSEELACRQGLDERYVREWLEQQAVAGLLEAGSWPGSVGIVPERRFWLSASHREVLTVSNSALSMISLTALPLGGVAQALPQLLKAFRHGGGVADSEFGDDWRHGHGGTNRVLFGTVLPAWISRQLPQVDARLRQPGARVADVCCGAGWASLALARAYTKCRVDGYDIDERALHDARANATEAGLAQRVSFTVRDASGELIGQTYDLVLLLDTLHEAAHPVQVLKCCRGMAGQDGVVLILDARVEYDFVAPGDEVERFQYATSVLHCLPAGRAVPGSTTTGTVLRPAKVRDLAREAGFSTVEELPFDDRFHRMYRMAG